MLIDIWLAFEHLDQLVLIKLFLNEVVFDKNGNHKILKKNNGLYIFSVMLVLFVFVTLFDLLVF